jgi:acetolactate synthase-1/2/3 large subunit
MGDSIQTKVQADAGEFIRALLRRKSEFQRKDRSPWKQRCADWKNRYPVIQPEHRKPEGRVSMYHLAEALQDVLPGNTPIVSGSSGSAIELFLLALRVKTGQRVFHTTALGAMGYGIAASIGVCMANGRRPVVCVDGDGGFQFNIQELETVSRLRLPITFFVLNNDGYASIRASQTNFFGAPRIGCSPETGQTLPDITKVAQAYGLQTDVIRDQSDLRADLRRVLNRGGPLVCDTFIIPDESRGPRLSSMQRPDGSFVSKPLEDLYPFLSREEFLSNMLIPVEEE